MIKAAMGGHLEAMYALTIIQFNGSGGTRTDRRLEMEAGLCTRAANMGHTGALRELGFYLRDGYGVLHATQDGRRLIIQAKNHESATAGTCNDTAVANKFLTEWFAPVGAPGASTIIGEEGGGPPLRLCSYMLSGRQETRQHEFCRCTLCAAANYCSRSCQSKDWKIGHMEACIPRVVEIAADVPVKEQAL
jgi:hypothetical protein